MQRMNELINRINRGESKFEAVRVRSKNQPFDIYIKAGKMKIAALKDVSEQRDTKWKELFDEDFYFIAKVRYCIYVKNKIFYIYDRFSDCSSSPIECNEEKLLKHISEDVRETVLPKFRNTIIQLFMSCYENGNYSFNELLEYIDEHKERIRRDIRMSNDYDLYFESGEGDYNFEDVLFNNLINYKRLPISQIYRYCSFGRGFQILNEGKIALLGLFGMNDNTEPNHAIDYINGSVGGLATLSPQTISALNRRFILSCTTNSNNLLHWRLYGDDAKGMVLKFIPEDQSSIGSDYYLGHVKYADENDKHIELEFIKDIVASTKKILRCKLNFNSLYYWRHFFKPKEYSHEKEVRLLYVHRYYTPAKKWLLADPYQIVNPFVELDLFDGDFPLKLTEVILGPKSPEHEVNKIELAQLLHNKTSHIIPVTLSDIKNYR